MNHEKCVNIQNGNNGWGTADNGPEPSNSLSDATRATLQEDLRRTLEEGREAHPELPDEYFEFIKKVLKKSQDNSSASTSLTPESSYEQNP